MRPCSRGSPTSEETEDAMGERRPAFDRHGGTGGSPEDRRVRRPDRRPLAEVINEFVYHERERLRREEDGSGTSPDLAFPSSVRRDLPRAGRAREIGLLTRIMERYADEICSHFNPLVYALRSRPEEDRFPLPGGASGTLDAAPGARPPRSLLPGRAAAPAPTGSKPHAKTACSASPSQRLSWPTRWSSPMLHSSRRSTASCTAGATRPWHSSGSCALLPM